MKFYQSLLYIPTHIAFNCDFHLSMQYPVIVRLHFIYILFHVGIQPQTNLEYLNLQEWVAKQGVMAPLKFKASPQECNFCKRKSLQISKVAPLTFSSLSIGIRTGRLEGWGSKALPQSFHRIVRIFLYTNIFQPPSFKPSPVLMWPNLSCFTYPVHMM